MRKLKKLTHINIPWSKLRGRFALRRNRNRTLSWTLFSFLLFFAALSTIGYGYLVWLSQGIPSLTELENPETAIASEVKSRDGVVLDKFYTENRTYVSLNDISPHVRSALIATEDHRFMDHWGVDLWRTLSVPYHILRGKIQGGSTISQQLARNLFRKVGKQFSIHRKLREILTAIHIERNYTKNEIIEMYLNTVEFPNSAFGIQTAAYTHYGKPAKYLNLNEAATLIGTLRAISYYNPRSYPERVVRRRNIVLQLMAKNGFITENDFYSLKDIPLFLDYHPPSQSRRTNRYFTEFIRLQIQDWIASNGYDLNKDGLTIHTTLDSRLQLIAEEVTIKKLNELQKIFEDEWTSPDGDYMDKLWSEYPSFLPSFIRETERYNNAFSEYDLTTEKEVMELLLQDQSFIDSVKKERTQLQSSFVAIDPSNGNVLVWVGGADFGTKQFDHVYQSKRQAGSTFKPFVYTVAIDNGFKPYYKFSKYPISFYDRSGRLWAPKDATIASGPDMIPLRQGLARSLNNVTVRLLPEIAGYPDTKDLDHLYVAADKIKNMAQKLGIQIGETNIYPSIALGAVEVSLLELVSAYTTFANQGVHIEPIAITRIEDKQGNIIAEYYPEYREEVISAQTAYTMLDMMRNVIRGGKGYYGTGIRLRNEFNIQQDIAGKTGTTQNSADNWFVGLTPHLVMGAWVGGEDRRIRFPKDTYIGQGARTALPIVGEFITEAKANPKVAWNTDSFKPPLEYVIQTDPNVDNDQKKKVRNLKRKGKIAW